MQNFDDLDIEGRHPSLLNQAENEKVINIFINLSIGSAMKRKYLWIIKNFLTLVNHLSSKNEKIFFKTIISEELLLLMIYFNKVCMCLTYLIFFSAGGI